MSASLAFGGAHLSYPSHPDVVEITRRLAEAERQKAANLQELLEVLSTKIGAVLLILGAMHFFNLYVFSKMRRRALLHSAPPPIPPQAHLPVAGR